MTIGVVIMLGAGIILIISAIEKVSLAYTLRGILAGTPINQLGANSSSTAPSPPTFTPLAKNLPPGTPPPPTIRAL